ncbi:MAG: hypothetical protein O3A13_08660 [Proteobacteria bacterium]|nr:hypothetical protein [Pseudomonadota bacterium]
MKRPGYSGRLPSYQFTGDALNQACPPKKLQFFLRSNVREIRNFLVDPLDFKPFQGSLDKRPADS